MDMETRLNQYKYIYDPISMSSFFHLKNNLLTPVRGTRQIMDRGMEVDVDCYDSALESTSALSSYLTLLDMFPFIRHDELYTQEGFCNEVDMHEVSCKGYIEALKEKIKTSR